MEKENNMVINITTPTTIKELVTQMTKHYLGCHKWYADNLSKDDFWWGRLDFGEMATYLYENDTQQLSLFLECVTEQVKATLSERATYDATYAVKQSLKNQLLYSSVEEPTLFKGQINDLVEGE